MILRRLKYLTSHLVSHQNMVKKILETTNLMNKTSSVTLGPNGRLVAIQSQVHQPRITKDGVTVIKSLQFEDRLMNSIGSLIKKAANNANKFSGDGTTTTTLLAFQLINPPKIRVRDESNAIQIRIVKRQKPYPLILIRAFYKGQYSNYDHIQLQKLKQVAMIATNQDNQLSDLVSQAIFKSQSVKIEKSKSTTSKLEFTSGFKITRGIPHQMLVNKINKIQFNYPAVLVFKGQIQQVKQILPAIQKAKIMKKPLVVFAQDISQSVCSMLYYNHMKGIIESCPVRVPQRGSTSGQYIPTLASITNSYLFSKYSQINLKQIDFNNFGKCIKITVDQFQTTIQSLSTNQSNNCVISIGGNSQSQIMEKYDKAVDALNSVSGAKKHGIVPGGGMSYYRAAQILEQYAKQQENQIYSQAFKVLSETLKQPLKTLMRLSQIEYIKQTKGWEGMNIITKQYGDLLEDGVIDSLMVAKNCIIDSVSVASMLLSLQLAIVNDTKYKQSDYNEYKGQFDL